MTTHRNLRWGNFGLVVEWLQFHPVTVRDTGSNPVGTAELKVMK